eukprot:6620386-Pyramimonas_sp.AAC.1
MADATPCLRGLAGDDGAAWCEGPGVRRGANLAHFVAFLAKTMSGMDVSEFCGGRGYVASAGYIRSDLLVILCAARTFGMRTNSGLSGDIWSVAGWLW